MSDITLNVKIDDTEELEGALVAAASAPSISATAVHGAPGPDGEPGQLVEPITAILIGAGVLAAAKFLVSLIERWRGGVVIDLRKGAEIEIRRDRNVPYLWVVVHPADGGAVTVDTKDEPKEAVERWITAVIEGGFTTVADLAKSAKDALTTGEVESEEAAQG